MDEFREAFIVLPADEDDLIAPLALTSVSSMRAAAMKPTAMKTASVETMGPSAMEERVGSGMGSADRA